MFTSPAFAQSSNAAAPMGLVDFLPFLLIIVIMYFLIFRPQQKRQKEHQTMLKGLRRGDVVVTGGGIVGKVVKVPGEGDEIQVEIADNVRVKVLRGTISQVVNRTEPSKGDQASDTGTG